MRRYLLERETKLACVERFLKSKGDNVKKAVKQLRACLSWRESIGIGKLLSHTNSHFKNSFVELFFKKKKFLKNNNYSLPFVLPSFFELVPNRQNEVIFINPNDEVQDIEFISLL